MVLALSLVLAQPAAPATRADMAERTLRMERTWRQVQDPARRRAAVDVLSRAVGAFFANQTGQVCQLLDQAEAALRNETVSPSAGWRVRVVPPVVAPGEPYQLVYSWAYGSGDPAPPAPKAGVAPDREGDITLDGPETLGRALTLSVVRDFESRRAALEQGDTLALARALTQIREGQYEWNAPAHAWLVSGERGRAEGWKNHEELPLVQAENTVFRAWIPKEATAKTPVVIALHGAGGSENMFYEGYGAGLARELAQKREWIFMTPRSSPTAPTNCLKWLQEARGLAPETVFIMGHSAGGGATVSSLARLTAPPNGIVLFAPATGAALPPAAQGVPTFLAVGEQEMGVLKTVSERLGALLKDRSDSKFMMVPNSEHLMIVADALEVSYEWMDQRLAD
jgi:predicted esterase